MALALQISKPEGLPYKLFIAFTIMPTVLLTYNFSNFVL